MKCKTKQENQKESTIFSINKQALLAGRWHYSNTIWYSAELMLGNDGDFSFYAQNCLGKTFTKGKWFKQNETIVLSSDNTYKPTRKEASTRFLSSDDTVKTFFNNERLQLKNDTLFFVGQNEILGGHKFVKEFATPLSSR
jgi:hypothetical protein